MDCRQPPFRLASTRIYKLTYTVPQALNSTSGLPIPLIHLILATPRCVDNVSSNVCSAEDATLHGENPQRNTPGKCSQCNDMPSAIGSTLPAPAPAHPLHAKPPACMPGQPVSKTGPAACTRHLPVRCCTSATTTQMTLLSPVKQTMQMRNYVCTAASAAFPAATLRRQQLPGCLPASHMHTTSPTMGPDNVAPRCNSAAIHTHWHYKRSSCTFPASCGDNHQACVAGNATSSWPLPTVEGNQTLPNLPFQPCFFSFWCFCWSFFPCCSFLLFSPLRFFSSVFSTMTGTSSAFTGR